MTWTSALIRQCTLAVYFRQQGCTQCRTATMHLALPVHPSAWFPNVRRYQKYGASRGRFVSSRSPVFYRRSEALVHPFFFLTPNVPIQISVYSAVTVRFIFNRRPQFLRIGSPSLFHGKHRVCSVPLQYGRPLTTYELIDNGPSKTSSLNTVDNPNVLCGIYTVH